jgi:hypothetical protein
MTTKYGSIIIGTGQAGVRVRFNAKCLGAEKRGDGRLPGPAIRSAEYDRSPLREVRGRARWDAVTVPELEVPGVTGRSRDAPGWPRGRGEVNRQ